MSELNHNGQQLVQNLAAQHGFSENAVRHMLDALNRGQSSQAQFNHQEFGGMGQWSRGGMTMIGDMFNNGLKARVDGLCADLSREMSGASLFLVPVSGDGSWSYSGSGSGWSWPAELGSPSSQGAQNDMRYAYFPQSRRLAISHGGKVTVYDTGEHKIGGFGQSQSGDQTLSFNSQFGLVSVARLPVVDVGAAPAPEAPDPVQPAAMETTVYDAPSASAPAAAAADMTDDQLFNRLEKLADFRDRGIITAEDFEAKKAELLARL